MSDQPHGKASGRMFRDRALEPSLEGGRGNYQTGSLQREGNFPLGTASGCFSCPFWWQLGKSDLRACVLAKSTNSRRSKKSQGMWLIGPAAQQQQGEGPEPPRQDWLAPGRAGSWAAEATEAVPVAKCPGQKSTEGI